MSFVFITHEDFADEPIAPSDTDISFANIFTERTLALYGVQPEDLNQAGLEWAKEYAKIVALRRLYLRLAQSEDSKYYEKSDMYLKMQNELQNLFNRQTMTTTGTSPQSYEVKRA
ncbi:MAG: hypothetical protein ACO2PP_10085 [Thermocrinis sp.]|jgi:hypothetical protein|uniref:hypothetical protein n=1 Tax=Thermocrinis sp. TaxID=2024383 RepID=UPI003BFB1FAD